MPVLCDTFRDDLAAYADGIGAAPEPTRVHVEQCLRCQAEIVQYRKLLRTLHGIRTEVLAPHPGFVTDVLVALEEAGERRAIRSMLSGRRVAYIGGIAAATAAAGGAAALVLARRGTLRTAS
ncbi:MAG TPA: hypothetical protein VGA13_00945 [Acidimicrobiales bacterium]|jgi:hypothetical protein